MSRILLPLTLLLLCGCSQCHEKKPASGHPSASSETGDDTPKYMRIGYSTVATERQLEVGRQCVKDDCKLVVTLIDHGERKGVLTTAHRLEGRRITHRSLEHGDEPRMQRYLTTVQTASAEAQHGLSGVAVMFRPYRVAANVTGLLVETKSVGLENDAGPEDQLFVADGDEVVSAWETPAGGGERHAVQHRDIDGDGIDELIYEEGSRARAFRWDPSKKRMVERPMP